MDMNTKQGDRCQKEEVRKKTTTQQQKKKKTKETHTSNRQELQLAPGGGISLTGTRLSLMRKGKTRV